MKPSDILKDARAILVDKGWTRGRYYRKGRHCALGAIVAATTDNHDLGRGMTPLEIEFAYDDVISYSSYAMDAERFLMRAAEDIGFTGVLPEPVDGPYFSFLRTHDVNDSQVNKKRVLEWFDLAIKIALDNEPQGA